MTTPDLAEHEVVVLTRYNAYWYCRTCPARAANARSLWRMPEIVAEAERHGVQVPDPGHDGATLVRA